ncbi:MAG: Spy/CpxP family protein refolding chaperone [Desulfobacteraceae bacterium]|nr:Spy/CpxP family protein refolding chaperone [Desulfobacteraceae bacterium]
MKKVFLGIVGVLFTAGWFFGSWLFMNSIAMGAQESGSQMAAGAPSGPRGEHHGDMRHMPMMDEEYLAKKLNLTEAQRKQVRTIFEEERALSEPLFQKMKEGHQQLRELGREGKFDEEKVRAAARAQSDNMVEMIVARERLHSRINAVLTPEQRARMESMHEKRMEQKGKMHHGKK